MKKALIALLFVSVVIGMAIPVMANLNITKELNIDMPGTNEATSSAAQTQQNSGNLQNNNDQDVIAGDATANSVASANADAVDGSYPDSIFTDTPTPTTTSSPAPTSTPTVTSAPPANSTPIPDTTTSDTSSISANAPDSSGEGSGCGGGAITRENLTNIKQHESKEMQVSTGAIVYRFTTLDVVKEAGFTARADEGCIMARVELLKGRPIQATSDIPGAIYFNLWVGAPEYGESSKIEAPYIVFSIPNEKNNEPVKLLMFKDSWIDLKTEKIGPGTYKAYTRGFGSFAIEVTHAELLRTSPEVPTQPAISPTVTTIAESVSQKPVNLVLILVLIVVLTVMVYLLRKYRI